MKYYHNLAIRMLVAFLLLIIPINIFYILLFKPTLIFSYQFLKPYYYVELTHSGLITKNVFLEFIPACIAASAYYLLALLILFTKDTSLRNGIYMFIIGSLLIFAMNILRIDFLIFILLEYGINLFSTLHLFFWKVLASIYVVFVWIFLSIMFDVKTIPIYSDLSYLYKRSIFYKK